MRNDPKLVNSVCPRTDVIDRKNPSKQPSQSSSSSKAQEEKPSPKNDITSRTMPRKRREWEWSGFYFEEIKRQRWEIIKGKGKTTEKGNVQHRRSTRGESEKREKEELYVKGPFYTREDKKELSDVIGVVNWKHQSHRLIRSHFLFRWSTPLDVLSFSFFSIDYFLDCVQQRSSIELHIMASNSGYAAGGIGRLEFSSRSNEDYNVQIKANAMAIIDYLPFYIKIIVSPLASVILNYILKVDDSYTVDVADARMSDSEAYITLKSLGAQIENLKGSSLTNYFDSSQHTFEKTISGTGDLHGYVGDIVDFCASYAGGHINTTAIKNLLTSLLKSEMEEERLTINKTETIVIYTTRHDECGVMRVTFTGDQIKMNNCCSSSAKTKINVQKVIIMFRNTKDLLTMLRTFVQANR